MYRIVTAILLLNNTITIIVISDLRETNGVAPDIDGSNKILYSKSYIFDTCRCPGPNSRRGRSCCDMADLTTQTSRPEKKTSNINSVT